VSGGGEVGGIVIMPAKPKKPPIDRSRSGRIWTTPRKKS